MNLKIIMFRAQTTKRIEERGRRVRELAFKRTDSDSSYCSKSFRQPASCIIWFALPFNRVTWSLGYPSLGSVTSNILFRLSAFRWNFSLYLALAYCISSFVGFFIFMILIFKISKTILLNLDNASQLKKH